MLESSNWITCWTRFDRSFSLLEMKKIRHCHSGSFRFLHGRLRTATLRNDFEGTAVLINLLLRNYLHYNLYSQAQKLVLRSVFPDHASNNEWARYLYYVGKSWVNCIIHWFHWFFFICRSGRIRAMQLEYTKAHQDLLTAIRKAPQQTAIGFRQNVKQNRSDHSVSLNSLKF